MFKKFRFIALLLAVSTSVGLINITSKVLGDTPKNVSAATAVTEANNLSIWPSISADGRYVAFCSRASNLVIDDKNDSPDVFVRDLIIGETSRVSLSSDGVEADFLGGCQISTFVDGSVAISGDARFVAFHSSAKNLVPGDTNNLEDVFLHDRISSETIRVSVSSNDSEGDNVSWMPSISTNGRYVAFASQASNLVPSDTNNQMDVFAHDLQTGDTIRVSVSSDGSQANEGSFAASRGAISGDGQKVVFSSFSSDLVPNDTNNNFDVFVRDLTTQETILVSITLEGEPAGGGDARISGDGRYVVFTSGSSNIVNGDTNDRADIFRYDLLTGETIRISVASDGTEANDSSGYTFISFDGQFVGYQSNANNLVPGDNNGTGDIFVHDAQTGETTRITIASDGTEANSSSTFASISADGRYIAFNSSATNLVENDTNDVSDVFIHDRQTGVTIRASVGSAPVEPTPTPVPTLRVSYIALGDSIASGHGLMDDYPSACRRSVKSYPYKVKDKLSDKYLLDEFYHYACSGATAKLDQRKIDETGEQFKYLGYQVRQAGFVINTFIPDNEKIIVSISIGANDFNWTDRNNFIERLYINRERTYQTWVNSTAASVGKELIRNINNLLKYPNVYVVINEIYNPMNTQSVFFKSPLSGLCLSIFCYGRVDYAVLKLNETYLSVQQNVIDPNRVIVTDGLYFDFLGRESPRPTCGDHTPDVPQTWIQYKDDPDSNSNPTELPDWLGPDGDWKGDCFHPNEKGAEGLAQAVFDAVNLLLQNSISSDMGY